MKHLALWALVLTAPASGQTPKTPTPPNIVLVMTDDQGWGDLQHRGHAVLRTPHLDAMAAAGLSFERFYAGAPVCSPTRGTCLTGRHPSRYGIAGANSGHLPEDENNLAKILRAKGFRTGHFGKWHLGTLTRKGRDSNRGGARNLAHYAPPWDRGFDVCFSTEAKVPTFDPMRTPGRFAGGVGRKKVGTEYGTAYWRGPGQRVTEGLAGDDSALIMDRALKFIRETHAAQAPFFTVIWFHAPHLPVVAGPAQLARYEDVQDLQTRHYYGCLSAVDDQIGRLRATLRELKAADRTLVWFCSDNGPEGRAGKAPGSAGPLRGRKRSLYEGGIRVPGILEWPAEISKPRRTNLPATTADILPTVLALVGATAARPTDGISLAPLIAGEMKRRPKPIGFAYQRRVAWIDNEFKLVRDGRKREYELFNLAADPGETEDLAATDPERARKMRSALAAWLADCARPDAGEKRRD